MKTVPINVKYTYKLLTDLIEILKTEYPFLEHGFIGESVMGKKIPYLQIGKGKKKIFYNCTHHANEWITTVLVMRFLEDYLNAFLCGGTIFGEDARELYHKATLFIVPMVNPDGVDLINDNVYEEKYKTAAKIIKENYPEIKYPDGWKANINGVDLNLQYPANWGTAQKIKFSQGYTIPSPKNFVGKEPLFEPESRAMYEFTIKNKFDLTISFHSQGKEIYWKYLDSEPSNSRKIAEYFSQISGYTLTDVPYNSSFAGYKDWFIETFNKPAFTVEVGLGESPLPLSQFSEIYNDILGILVGGLLV